MLRKPLGLFEPARSKVQVYFSVNCVAAGLALSDSRRTV